MQTVALPLQTGFESWLRSLHAFSVSWVRPEGPRPLGPEALGKSDLRIRSSRLVTAKAITLATCGEGFALPVVTVNEQGVVETGQLAPVEVSHQRIMTGFWPI